MEVTLQQAAAAPAIAAAEEVDGARAIDRQHLRGRGGGHMHASAFRDQSFADVDGGTFARVAGVGLEGETENCHYFAI